MAKVDIDEDESLSAALAAALKEYTNAIEMEQTRAKLNGQNLQTVNIFEAMVKHLRLNEVKKIKKK